MARPGITVPTGVINPYSIHQVQTFRGNYDVRRTFSTTVRKDDYFGTFFFAQNWNTDGYYAAGQIIADANYQGGADLTAVSATRGGYDRGSDDTGVNATAAFPLFPFDVDGVQGAVKETGNEKWISFKNYYNVALTFESKAGTGNIYSRGTWRFDMMKDPSMAKSLRTTSQNYIRITGTGRYSTTTTGTASSPSTRIHNLQSTSGLNP